MAIRFRRSIKILKGLKVNVNKNSVGLSVGRRGLGYTINSKGRKTSHIGIPGTGLSVVNTKTPKSTPTVTNRAANTNSNIGETTIRMHLDEEGNMTYFYPDDTQITDPAVIRQIVNAPGYKAEKERMTIARNQNILDEVNQYNEANEDLINISKQSPARILDESDYIEELNNIEEKKYKIRSFNEPMPTVEDVKENLMKIAKEEIKGLFSAGEQRREYVENNYEKLFNTRMNYWNKKKEEFDANEKKIEIEENKKYKEEYENERKYINNIIKGEEEDVCNDIDLWLQGLEMPLEFNVNYDYSQSKGTLYVDLDLPEIEDMPDRYYRRMADGSYKLKDKAQKTIKEDYYKCVIGLAMCFVTNLFKCAIGVNTIVLSAYTQRRDSKGIINDDYILSFEFDRDQLADMNIGDTFEETEKALFSFNGKCQVLSDRSFKTIEPL